MYDLAGRANHYHSGTEMALTSKDGDVGAVGLRRLKKSLQEGEEYTRTKESLGKRKRFEISQLSSGDSKVGDRATRGPGGSRPRG